jgi:hypothetical protein
MDKHCATKGISHNQPCVSAEPPDSPVGMAIARVREEIIECHYHIDMLIGGVGSALRPQGPSELMPDRMEAASPLANEIELIADNIRNMRLKITDARERLTL